jgi:hypothetical protein
MEKVRSSAHGSASDDGQFRTATLHFPWGVRTIFIPSSERHQKCAVVKANVSLLTNVSFLRTNVSFLRFFLGCRSVLEGESVGTGNW